MLMEALQMLKYSYKKERLNFMQPYQQLLMEMLEVDDGKDILRGASTSSNGLHQLMSRLEENESESLKMPEDEA